MRVHLAIAASSLILATSAQLLPFNKPDTQSIMGEVSLSDVMGLDRSINIFAGFTRDIDSVSDRLNSQSSNTTVLAPLNSEITKLPRKPWEDPEDYAALGQGAYDGQSGEDRAHRNMRRFVESHIVPVSPWEEGHKVQTLGGNTVWWENKDGKTLIQPGAIEVTSAGKKVGNGEVWVLGGVVNYAQGQA